MEGNGKEGGRMGNGEEGESAAWGEGGIPVSRCSINIVGVFTIFQ